MPLIPWLRLRRALRSWLLPPPPSLSPPPDLSETDLAFLTAIDAVIAEGIARPDFTAAEMAAMLDVSRRTLERRLRALTGETPAALLRRHRLSHAAHLLETGEASSLADAARAVGYLDPHYFVRRYHDRLVDPTGPTIADEH